MYFQFHTPKDMLHKFLRLYDLQKQGQSFETPEAFLQELDLYSLTQTSMRAYITVRPFPPLQTLGCVHQHPRPL